MGYEMTGAVKLVGDLQTFASGFQKKEFVITTKDRFPQDVKFECVKERTALLDGVAPGAEVVVHFDVRGNEYSGNHYVNLNCWKIEAAAQGQTPPAAQPQDQPPEDTGPLPF